MTILSTQPFRHVLLLLSAAFLAGCSNGSDAPSSKHNHDASIEHAHDEAGNHLDTEHSEHDGEDKDHSAHDHTGADDEHQHDGRSAGAHVHGAANLSIVLDGKTVNIELETPLYNLLGFEHAPKTPEQKEAVAAATATLEQPGSILSFNSAAGCKPAPASTDKHVHFFDDHDHAHDDEHNHQEEDDAHGHKNFVIDYKYNCKAPQKLDAATIGLFKAFPNFSEIDVVFLGPSRQVALEATADKPRIHLSGQ